MADHTFGSTSTDTAEQSVELGVGTELTPLEKLRAKVREEVKREEVQIEVPERSGVTLRIDPNFTEEKIKQLSRKAGEGRKSGFDEIKFATLVIAHATTGVFVDGEEVFDEDDNEVTFASEVIAEMVEAEDPFEAVRKMYGLDPHIQAASMKILELAGWGDVVNTVDPPSGS